MANSKAVSHSQQVIRMISPNQISYLSSTGLLMIHPIVLYWWPKVSCCAGLAYLGCAGPEVSPRLSNRSSRRCVSNHHISVNDSFAIPRLHSLYLVWPSVALESIFKSFYLMK